MLLCDVPLARWNHSVYRPAPVALEQRHPIRSESIGRRHNYATAEIAASDVEISLSYNPELFPTAHVIGDANSFGGELPRITGILSIRGNLLLSGCGSRDSFSAALHTNREIPVALSYTVADAGGFHHAAPAVSRPSGALADRIAAHRARLHVLDCVSASRCEQRNAGVSQ